MLHTQNARLLALLDLEIAAYGQVHDGGRYVLISALLSINVLISPGVRPSGGLYWGAMASRVGSRPRIRYSCSMNTKLTIGIRKIQFAPKKRFTFSAVVGRAITPGSHAIETVTPSCISSGAVV